MDYDHNNNLEIMNIKTDALDHRIVTVFCTFLHTNSKPRYSVRHLRSARHFPLPNAGVRTREQRTMQPSGSTSEGPGTAPNPVRTAVAQATHTVRYRRDLRRSSEVFAAISKDELILVNAAVKACSTQVAATLDSAQLVEKIKAYLTAHERRDTEQLRLISLHERSRESLLLAPEGPIYDSNSPVSCLSQIVRFQEKVTQSDLLSALAKDLEGVQCNLLTYSNVIPKENQASYNRANRHLEEMQSCLRFHSIMAPFTPPPEENTPVPSASTRPYRDAAPAKPCPRRHPNH